MTFFVGMPFTSTTKLFSKAELIPKVDIYSSKRNRRYITLPFNALTNTQASEEMEGAHSHCSLEQLSEKTLQPEYFFFFFLVYKYPVSFGLGPFSQNHNII